MSSGKCKRGDLTVVDWFEKVAAVDQNIVCPDKQSECKSGQTCCKLATGNYGCCPIPKVMFQQLADGAKCPSLPMLLRKQERNIYTVNSEIIAGIYYCECFIFDNNASFIIAIL